MSRLTRIKEQKSFIAHKHALNLAGLVVAGMYSQQEALRERADMARLLTKMRKKKSGVRP